MNNTILVTGAAGFIGFYLSKSLLNDGFSVVGVDTAVTSLSVGGLSL